MNKYHAKQTKIDGLTFHSKKEANRYLELKMCMKAKGNDKVLNLELQPKFECIVNGKKICNYFADFRIEYADGRVVIEDVKGCKKGCAYQLFRLKKKLVGAQFGVEIIET